jgi:hypothetical protein
MVSFSDLQKVFKNEPWAGFLLALGLVVGVALVVELIQWLAARHKTVEKVA